MLNKVLQETLGEKNNSVKKINKVLQDPLLEKNILPTFAHTLNITHWSPTSLITIDPSFIFKYLFLTQAQRRLLPKNSQMMAGVACGNAVQLAIATELWKLNKLTKKLVPTVHERLSQEAALQVALEEFKEYQPNDDKDQTKKDHYIETIPQTVHQIFLALEKLYGGVLVSAPIVVCEKHISKSDPNLLIEIVGRPDFQFGAFPEETKTSSFPPSTSGSFLVELKTVHDRFGKLKKDGSYTQLNAKLPTSPSEAHLMQCAFYSAVYDYQYPIFLVYACKDDHEIYDSSNCPGLTKEGIKKNYNKLVAVAKRRERMMARYEHMDKNSMIQNLCADTDPNWSHPYMWNIGPEFLKAAKELWNLQ